MRIEQTVFPCHVAAVKVGIGGVRPPCRAAPLPRWPCAAARKRADPYPRRARHGIASPWANLAPSSLRQCFVKRSSRNGVNGWDVLQSLFHYQLGGPGGWLATLPILKPCILQLPLNCGLKRRRIAQGCAEVNLAIAAEVLVNDSFHGFALHVGKQQRKRLNLHPVVWL